MDDLEAVDRWNRALERALAGEAGAPADPELQDTPVVMRLLQADYSASSRIRAALRSRLAEQAGAGSPVEGAGRRASYLPGRGPRRLVWAGLFAALAILAVLGYQLMAPTPGTATPSVTATFTTPTIEQTGVGSLPRTQHVAWRPTPAPRPTAVPAEAAPVSRVFSRQPVYPFWGSH